MWDNGDMASTMRNERDPFQMLAFHWRRAKLFMRFSWLNHLKVIFGWASKAAWSWVAILFIVATAWGFAGTMVSATLSVRVPSEIELTQIEALFVFGNLLLFLKISHSAWTAKELAILPRRYIAIGMALIVGTIVSVKEVSFFDSKRSSESINVAALLARSTPQVPTLQSLPQPKPVGSIIQQVTKVEPLPASAPRIASLQFSFWVATPAAFPLTMQSLRPGPNNAFAVEVTAQNISNVSANDGEIWIMICQVCSFVDEPVGFTRLQGMSEKMRYKRFTFIRPGIFLERMTINVTMPSAAFKIGSFEMSLKYACAECGRVDNWQTLRVWIVKPPVLHWPGAIKK
jgi:hypothetical protein